MRKKYESANDTSCKYCDLSSADIYKLVRLESTELERSDLKALIMELCTRILNDGKN